jgi:heme-degrading monooxygenase HmoA
MTVKILIKRHVTQGQQGELETLLKQMRQLTTSQEGYLYGETMARLDQPDEYLVISTWQSVEHWRRWLASAERARIQNRIDQLLGKPTEYAVYAYQ